MARITGTESPDILIGTAENDNINGRGGNDSLFGLSGNDRLTGGAGTDDMVGGPGNDIYRVDVFVGDQVIVTDLLGNENIGIVIALLGETVRVEINLNGLIQILTLPIANIQSSDEVIEGPGEGVDRVAASVSYTLPANVENLNLLGREAINGTGNSLANLIIGNAAANTLNGLAGNDRHFGGTGSDTINGGAGADRLKGGPGSDDLRGGTGNDRYNVDNAGDIVREFALGGVDQVVSTVSFVLPEHVENLKLLRTNPIDGTGNDLTNVIVGNGGANVINGLGGNDRIFGQVGNDILNGGVGNDTVRGSFGADRINGGPGNDTLEGGTGPDTFVFNSPLNGSTNVDRIIDFSSPRDTMELDQSVFTQLSLGTLSASAFTTGTTAQDANDRIIYDSSTGRIFYDADGSGPEGRCCSRR